MSRRPTTVVAIMVAGVAAAAVTLLQVSGHASLQAESKLVDSARRVTSVRPSSGYPFGHNTAVRIANVGRITFECTRAGRDLQVASTLHYNGGQVWVKSQGHPVRRFDEPSAKLTAPPQVAGLQVWHIRYIAEPATETARVRIEFGASESSGCYPKRTSVHTQIRLH